MARNYLSKAARYQKVENWLSSGVSRKAYSLSQGLVYATFCSWVNQYIKEAGEPIKGLPTSPPLGSEPLSSTPSANFLPIHIEEGTPCHPVMEVLLPTGVVIRSYSILPLDYLASLLQSC